ncbi:MAG: hypothetical protein A2X86_16285 [Bdellovibrionales bacterium GWA2_49_15]|nr:MAG: hypothetical protein A2X86_16285 [Bdellovibrionales bacterium GWA2_49_15]HAZ13665.1 hypothetical protein [Bdellovibrionales bacterium]
MKEKNDFKGKCGACKGLPVSIYEQAYFFKKVIIKFPQNKKTKYGFYFTYETVKYAAEFL